MKYGVLFGTVSVLCVVLAFQQRGAFISLIWPACSFGIVALGYLVYGPIVYGKSDTGTLSL